MATDVKYWWKDASIYELYIDKFAGTIPGLTKKLDYFPKLGINALHILPHYPSPMVDGGYDVMDYLNVRPELGTLEDFEKLVEECHKRDIRIIIDFVLNHVSEHHPWFIEARSSKESLKRDFFLWSETGLEYRGGWNAFPDIKSANWRWNDATQDYYYATFYPEQPDLNWNNPLVYEAMVGNMDFWAERGVDGFRLDSARTLVKRDGTLSQGLPETHDILKRIRKHLDDTHGGNMILLAETHQSIEESREYFGNGDECHLVYNFPLMERMFLTLMLNEPARMDAVMWESSAVPENCAWAVFLRNHDEISLATLPLIRRTTLVNMLDPDHQYLFNHGSATAVRLASIFKGDTARILEAFRLLYSMPGAHIMYYGDEIGMQNLPVKDGIIDTRLFVRGNFDWKEAQRQMKDPESLWSKTAKLMRG